MTANVVVTREGLDLHINELIAAAKSLTPDVQTVVNIPGYEGQHAWVKIYVPDEVEEQIDDLIIERIYDIFMETGYDIGAMVYGKSLLQEMAA